jgi:hypothetical protein
VARQGWFGVLLFGALEDLGTHMRRREGGLLLLFVNEQRKREVTKGKGKRGTKWFHKAKKCRGREERVIRH